MNKSRLSIKYNNEIRPNLQKQLALDNIMMVPKLLKVVLNVGSKDAVSDSKVLQEAIDVLTKISGQRAVKRLARKSIAGFKLREGMPIGAMVTLRGSMMYEFLDRFITLALPKVRDFQGLSTKLDGRGSYNVGIKDWTIFPEVDFDIGKKTHGLNITIQTSAHKDEHGLALLQAFDVPFKKFKN
ncbi:MAG TPA: 50S ribosomal protein L5 [Candidatus Babeliales bacterium]|jgi:large subunit ribosomal protein L5|nr:50S ribosomal protein L5 [Candidatus Babeliales bacterium]